MNQTISKKEYIENYAPEMVRKNIKTEAILAYICVGISLIAAIFLYKSVASVIEVLIILGLALGMHLGKSNVCAILLLLIGVLEWGIKCALTNSYTPNLILLVGVYSVINFHKASKMYKEFIQSGKVTEE